MVLLYVCRMDDNHIGKQLTYWRKKAGLTQGELGEKLGMSKQQIAYYENGHRTPTLHKTLPAICEAIGIDFDIVFREK